MRSFRSPPSQPLDRASSPLARQASIACALLIAFISWYPLSGWRDQGISPFAFLFAPFPSYRPIFDLLSNLLAYLPFGFLLALALYPKIRGLAACLLATLIGLLWSGLMELGQVYLPARVPSNLDTLLNTVGTWLGAIIGAARAPSLLGRGTLARCGARWLVPDASFGLILLALWYGAQLQPQLYAFGLGDWVQALWPWLANWGPELLAGLSWYNWAHISSDDFVAFECLIVACQVSAAGLLLLQLLHLQAPRRRLLLLALVLALLTKALAHRLLLGVAATWDWLTPGALAGLLMSGVLLLGATSTTVTPRVLLRLTLSMLIFSLLITNLAPENFYAAARLASWSPGQWLNLHGVVRVLDWLWPALALGYIIQRFGKIE